MAALLRRRGVDAGTFAARRPTEKQVKEADLVLALTRAQRSLVVEFWPPAVRRTFTVREFARLLQQIDTSALPEGTPAARMRAATPLVAAKRGLKRTSPNDDDVVDPFRLGDEIYLTSFAEITASEGHRRSDWAGPGMKACQLRLRGTHAARRRTRRPSELEVRAGTLRCGIRDAVPLSALRMGAI
jgi:protein-tyrosine-phosphatase